MKYLILILAISMSVAAQTKTVTNSDLEKFRQERLKAEKDYRESYAKRGLPSPEEIERINDQKRRELSELASDLRQERQASEYGIRERSELLRSQIASIDSQIAYLRGIRRSNFSQPLAFWSFAYQGLGYRGPIYGRTRGNVRPLPPNLQTVTDISRMYPNSRDVYNRATGNYAFMRQRPRGGYFGNGYLSPVIATVGSYDEAGSQIIYLEQVRAGLAAEWRIVEEDARRAGIRLY
ncbi:MAG TPA: hypothetical protein PKM58_03090 [Pyrinomonadaceae bacterium]|nr:hypothetical protein [Pyrinomonadaceae bacterium]